MRRLQYSDQIRLHSICSTLVQTKHSYGADQLMREGAFYATNAQHHATSNMQQRESRMVPVYKIVSWISMDIRSLALPMTLAQCTAHINAWHGILTSATSLFMIVCISKCGFLLAALSLLVSIAQRNTKAADDLLPMQKAHSQEIARCHAAADCACVLPP